MQLDMMQKARNGRRDALRFVRNKAQTPKTEYNSDNIFAIADWGFDGGNTSHLRHAKTGANSALRALV